MRIELAAKLKAGGCTLYFDTNEIRGKYADEVKAFNNFCRQVKRLQQLDAKAPTVRVFAVNHFEMMHQLRRMRADFDESIITASLQTLEIPIVPLDLASANHCAKHLHHWFPTDADWRDAKKPANDKVRFKLGRPSTGLSAHTYAPPMRSWLPQMAATNFEKGKLRSAALSVVS